MLARMLLLAGAASSLVAQAPAFDVASIKPLSPGAPPARWEAGHGVLRAGTTPRWLIQFAYGVPSPLLEGAPAWTEQEFFDVNARGDPSAGEAQIARMLQSLLAARFQLRVHRENQTRGGWEAVTRFLEDGELEIDNGATERANRDIALGRGNWTFFGSDNGGKTAAVLRSFVASCKRCAVEPLAWFRDVLSRIPAHSITRLSELLPHNRQTAASSS